VETTISQLVKNFVYGIKWFFLTKI
jgi:hypothetical protein